MDYGERRSGWLEVHNTDIAKVTVQKNSQSLIPFMKIEIKPEKQFESLGLYSNFTFRIYGDKFGTNHLDTIFNALLNPERLYALLKRFQSTLFAEQSAEVEILLNAMLNEMHTKRFWSDWEAFKFNEGV